MKRRFSYMVVLLVVSLLLSCGVAFALPAATSAGAKSSFILATGGKGNAYNVIGQQLADFVNSAGNFSISVAATSGSMQNAELISKNPNTFAFMQNDVLHWATMGEMMFKGKKNSNFRLLACLYDEPLFLVTRRAANIKTPKDLKGHNICVGLEGSGDEAECIVVLDIVGFDLDKDFPRHIHGSYTTMAKLLNEGKIDACFVMGNANFKKMRETCANTPLDIVNFPTEFLDNLTAKYPFFWFHIVPANTFDNDDLVQTPCVMAMLVADYRLPDAVVDGVLTSLFDSSNLEVIRNLNDSAKKIGLDDAFLALSIPYHRAAVNFYKAKGIIK